MRIGKTIIIIITLALITTSCGLKEDPAASLIEEAKKLIDNGDYKEALRLIDEIIAGGYKGEDLEELKILSKNLSLYLKGKGYFESEEYTKAEDLFLKLKKREESNFLRKDIDNYIREIEDLQETKKIEEEILVKEKLEEERVEQKKLKEKTSNEELQGILLESTSVNWIYLDGESISIGEEKELEVDLDKDGSKELFIIRRGAPNATDVIGIGSEVGENLMYNISIHEFFNDYGDLNPENGVQLTCIDLDGDEIDEVLVSVGNSQDEMETIIYKFIDESERAFEYKGGILGKEKQIIRNSIIYSKDREYKYINENIIEDKE